MSDNAAGFDIFARLEKPIVLEPGKRAVIPAGFAIEIPRGFEGQVRPRSGLAAEHGVTMLNSPGTIDPDYRGEVKVIAVNLGDENFTIKPGDRIAQLIISPVASPSFEVVYELTPAKRGCGGFGSTGR